MRKLTLTAVMAAVMAALMISYQADAQLGRLMKKKDEASSESSGKSYEDPTGTSGTYTAIDGIEVQSRNGKKVKKVEVEFVGERNGSFVNEFIIHPSGNARDDYKFNEHLKMSKKTKTRVWRFSSFHSIWIMELEKNVFAVLVNSSTHREELDGKEKVEDVIAKDPEKLKEWDLETAKAKFDAAMRGASKAESDKVKNRLMEDYPVYKKNVGKVVFANSYRIFNYQYTDQPKDDETKFIKTSPLGSPLYFAAYFDKTIESVCGKDCELDVVYELGSSKASRVELRRTNKQWQDLIKKKDRNNSQYCYNSGHQLWSPSEDIMDAAFWKVIYENKPTFKVGGQYKLKVTLYASRDGNRGEKLAEGTVTLTYTDKSANDMERPMKAMRDIMED